VYLLSTTLQGPATVNPWKRKHPILDLGVMETTTSKTGKRKRKREGVKTSVGTGNVGKVSQYFPVQKNSQERDIGKSKGSGKAVGKYAIEADDPIISDDTTTQTHAVTTPNGCVSQSKHAHFTSPGPVKAIPRIIDFDQLPPSASIPSSNFPSLQVIRNNYEPGQRLSPLRDPIDNSTVEGTSRASSGTGDDCLGLLDEPTPQQQNVKKSVLSTPKQDLESIHKLVGDPSQIDEAENTPFNLELFDDPTPTHYKPLSPRKTVSRSKLATLPSPNDFTPILPASITRCSRLTSSPRKSPLQVLSPLPHLNTPVPSRRRNDRRRSSSFSGLLPAANPERVALQRSQTHNGVLPRSPPLNTQALFDRANESFNNAILPTITTPSLLPPVSLIPSNVKPRTGFTPFKDLNRSPTPRDSLSFQLSSAQVDGSPLSYSPVNQEALWNDIEGILSKAAWDLQEEVDKAVRMAAGESVTSTSQGKGCAVGA
jgi:hypothetical protein